MNIITGSYTDIKKKKQNGMHRQEKLSDLATKQRNVCTLTQGFDLWNRMSF